MTNTTKHEYSVPPEQFLTVKKPEIAYLLGLIWADGYVKHGSNIRKTGSIHEFNRIEVSMNTSDMELLVPLFNFTGKWCIYTRCRLNRKSSTSVITNNAPLVKFLCDHDYHVKSESSACKILSEIPQHLKKYWFRGVIDGDGCFYLNPKNKQVQFGITSSLNQNWTYFENLLANLGIRFTFQKISRNIGEHSTLRITNGEGIIKLGNYIYDEFQIDKIGLERKYQKYLQIKALKYHLTQEYKNNITSQILSVSNS